MNMMVPTTKLLTKHALHIKYRSLIKRLNLKHRHEPDKQSTNERLC